jgi:hypothetical protein
MKTRKMALLAFAATTLLAWAASASASNGMVISTISFPEGPYYVPCLGEELNGITQVTAYGHIFQTPSGVGHLIDNYKFKAYFTGATTGRIWLGQGFSPWVENGAAGEHSVFNFRTGVRYKPFNDNGSFPSFPELRFAWRAKMTLNANGEITVMIPLPETLEEVGSAFKCFGPGY